MHLQGSSPRMRAGKLNIFVTSTTLSTGIDCGEHADMIPNALNDSTLSIDSKVSSCSSLPK